MHRRSFSRLFFLVLVLSVYTTESTVVELTSQNFPTFVANSRSDWLIEFYAQWCQTCQRFEAIWTELGNQLSGKINVGRIDGPENRELTDQLNVDGYPTILTIRDGAVHEYKGALGYRELMEYAYRLHHPPVYSLRGEDAVQRFLRQYPVCFILLNADDQMDSDVLESDDTSSSSSSGNVGVGIINASVFQSIARYYQAWSASEANLGFAICAGTSQERALCLKTITLLYPGLTASLPQPTTTGGRFPPNSVGVFKDGSAAIYPRDPHDATSSFEALYDHVSSADASGPASRGLLWAWVDKEKSELVPLLKPVNFFDISNAGKHTVILMIDSSSATQRKYLDGVRNIAKRRKEFAYCYHDGVTDADRWFEHSQDHLGVGRDDLPAIVVLNAPYEVYFRVPSLPAPSKIDAALDTFLDDVLKVNVEAQGDGTTTISWLFYRMWTRVSQYLPPGIWDAYWPLILLSAITVLQYVWRKLTGSSSTPAPSPSTSTDASTSSQKEGSSSNINNDKIKKNNAADDDYISHANTPDADSADVSVDDSENDERREANNERKKDL
eukprot:TRINITY_DN2928_c1_g1::TRINITY_DN2928_c1_g1_i2::g.4194::m.4194 TRINITY_DN2928_c1_g1::TRINITY_DN2928_c1_g1_i2::g.4194  ORF type:complete len:556 (+),score=94.31,sp/Q6GNG3/TMX3_XENLA/22.78/9e-17,Thioredoxin/PF00085.15/1.9e-20,Thioredoxin_6/PF13848.1/6.3e+02,Thioredoxin_6/PF13848.1/0.12,Thioredoxin_6/PF13848.1/2.2e-10,Thioredoxin_2/PF13098.1/0.03,Thioredoxin_2/PF13098.1/6.7e+02,Thioredoxin_7/PF13899.1/0.0061,Thioredoxin_7/PF13899.1/2.8e+03,Thioredoxin_8/PF13905.1/1.5,Thioredoxin_8/PF13905.1/3.8e+02,